MLERRWSRLVGRRPVAWRAPALLVTAAATVVLAAAASAPAHPPKPPTVASPQVVLDWNATAVSTVLASGKGQPEAMVYMGLVQAAVYDAVIAVEGGFEPYLIVPGVPPGSSPEAAAAAAAYGVLVGYFPAQKAALDVAYSASLAAIPDGPAEDRGVLVGQQVAAGLSAARIDDGRGAPITFTPTPAPGVWRPTPPALLPALTPWMAAVKPFLLDEASQFRPGPPPALGSRRYARDFEEVRLYGGKTGSLRTPEQEATGRFWTEHVAPHYNRNLRSVVSKLSLNLREAARALGLANTTIADSLIACFDAKYEYGYWRPVTAIPLANTDGNGKTTADPAWEPLLPTPNHPEYPSAHNCATAAFGATVAELVGGSHIDLDMTSTATGATLHFERLNDLKRSIQDARVYTGFHWRTSDEVGYRLGERVSRWALKRYFEPED
jgi:hypothetical protein